MTNTFSPARPSAYAAIRGGLVRTYGDLVRVARDSGYGNCCACHDWDKPVWHISVRASICRACCERKSTEVLGSIVRAERKARRYAKDIVIRGEYAGGGNANEVNTKFYARLAGVSNEFMQSALDAEVLKL